MTDFQLHNLRPKLVERLQRLAELQDLPVDAVAAEALSLGVDAVEDRVRKHLLNTREQTALRQAIEEIQKVPDDAFGLIGRGRNPGGQAG
jgi:hypothetical protein